MTPKKLVFGLVAVVGLLGAMSGPAQAQFDVSSNRNDVRAGVAQGGWEIVWGELINEAEYVKACASIYGGNPWAYFSDYLERTIAKVERTAPNVAQGAIRNAVIRAFRDHGQSFRFGKVGVKAGLATYQRWKTVSVDIPDGTERYKIHGPFGSWTYGYRPRMKRIERQIPLPNHHQPYVGFRIYPG